MDELGNILREARRAKGLTLADVHRVLRINPEFLQALEEGAYYRLPSPVHGRGFLRNYARFLELDPDPLVERFLLTQTIKPQSLSAESKDPLPGQVLAPSRQDQPFFDPVNMEIGEDKEWRWEPDRGLRLFILLALILFVLLVGNRFLPLLLQQGQGIPLVNEQNVTDLLATPGGNNMLTEPITSTSRNVGATIVPPTPTRPALPATMETIQLRLNITERTWLRIVIDGQIVYEGLGRAQDLFEFEAFDEARVLTGNAAGVFVTINGVALNKMGGRGENKEEIWRTTGN